MIFPIPFYESQWSNVSQLSQQIWQLWKYGLSGLQTIIENIAW